MGKIMNFLLGKNKDFNSKKVKSYDLFIPSFSGMNDPEKNATFMSSVQTHARHTSKAKPQIYVKKEISEDKQHLTKLLTLRPNPTMNAPTFYEIIGRDYFLQNNVFIFIERDYLDFINPIKNLWIINPDANSMDVALTEDGKIYIKFRLEGQEKITDLNNIIHISRNANANDFFGKKDKSIETVLKVMQTNYEGIEQAIKTSAYIRFIVQYNTVLNQKAKEQKAKDFAESFLSTTSHGLAVIDGAEKVQQVDNNHKYANAEEMKVFKEQVMDYLGINEKIVKATFNEDEWQSYYESSLEPLFLKMESEMTYKLLASEEIDKGYHIRIDANTLHSASLKTRVQVANIIQKQPMYIPNVINELLFLEKSPNGDKEFSNLNYVQTDKQNEYQVNEESKDE